MNDLEPVRTIYRQRRKLVIARFKRNPSLRPIAARLRISHPTLAKIIAEPHYEPSYKVMDRLIKATTPKGSEVRVRAHTKGKLPGCPK